MPLLNVTFPKNAEVVCVTIVDMVNFKLIPTDKILDSIMKFNSKNDFDEDSSFSKLGLKSTNLLKNLGTFLLAFVAIAVIAITLLLVRKIALKFSIGRKVYMLIHTKIFFNSVIRSILTSYLIYSISCLTCLQNLNFDASGEIASSVLSILSIVFLCLLPFASLIFLKKFKHKLEDP